MRGGGESFREPPPMGRGDNRETDMSQNKGDDELPFVDPEDVKLVEGSAKGEAPEGQFPTPDMSDILDTEIKFESAEGGQEAMEIMQKRIDEIGADKAGEVAHMVKAVPMKEWGKNLRRIRHDAVEEILAVNPNANYDSATNSIVRALEGIHAGLKEEEAAAKTEEERFELEKRAGDIDSAKNQLEQWWDTATAEDLKSELGKKFLAEVHVEVVGSEPMTKDAKTERLNLLQEKWSQTAGDKNLGQEYQAVNNLIERMITVIPEKAGSEEKEFSAEEVDKDVDELFSGLG
ncbi:hypothetical protein AMJ57_01690 [Parcubacteria bacterium SG8_24]|nr:MAG: hypothetical protein AMJ57_01690 [Parcubacteria bacterium SG8_24]